MALLGWLSQGKKAFSPDTAPGSFDTSWPDQRERLADAPYLLPKDAEEDNRLDYQHHVLHLSLGGHFLAPLPSQLAHVLDVGTGTGIWAAEMARLYPDAQVVGVDIGLGSFQADLPANCVLQFGNVLERLPFADETFDYTHQRFLVAAIPGARWPDVIQELVRVTRPGGWVELLEINNVFVNPGPETMHLAGWIASVSQTLGFDAEAVPSIGRRLTAAGIQSVVTRDIVVPLGAWGGTMAGALLKRDLLAGFDAAKGFYCARADMPIKVFEDLVQTVAVEWEEYHTSYTFHATYGRKAEQ
jgi:SAM-dependent methyltransferase